MASWNTDGIGSTSTDAYIIQNTAAATVGAQQWSGRMRWTGAGWKTNATAASQVVDWICEAQPVQGAASPSVNLVFSSQINAGGYSARMTLDSAGVLTLPSLASGLVTSASGALTANTGTSGGVPYFNSSSTIASSAALTASAIVVGGGAGVSPAVLSLGTANQVVGMNNAGTANEYKTITAGTNISVVHGANSITINNTGGASTIVPDKQGAAVNTTTGDGTEQTAYTYTIPGGTLSATGVVRLHFIIATKQGIASTSTWVVKVKLGGTTLFISPSIPTTSSNCFSMGEIYIGQQNSTSSQAASGLLYTKGANSSTTAAATNIYQADVAANVNMASSIALTVTVTETLATGVTHGTFAVLHGYTEIFA